MYENLHKMNPPIKIMTCKITPKTVNCSFKAIFRCFKINSISVKKQKIAQLSIARAKKEFAITQMKVEKSRNIM